MSAEHIRVPFDDQPLEMIVGKVSGPLRHLDHQTANVVTRVTVQTRWVLFRNHLGEVSLRPFSSDLPMHWQDISDLELTPKELENVEINLKSDEDMGNGFNSQIRNDRKSHAASKILWPIGYKPKVCVNR